LSFAIWLAGKVMILVVAATGALLAAGVVPVAAAELDELPDELHPAVIAATAAHAVSRMPSLALLVFLTPAHFHSFSHPRRALPGC
jgi:hypothetical protein